MNVPAPTEPKDPGLRKEIAQMESQFTAVLPKHIPPDRFVRVVQTALLSNPELEQADRRTLFEAALKAAQDGLLPDGRDGALVIFKSKDQKETKRVNRDVWVKRVQWMPMITGILKKARNSGDIANIISEIVYEKDQFRYRPGIDDVPAHDPDWFGDRGKPIGAYAVGRTKDGAAYVEIMSLRQIEKVRNVSRAKDSGPWKDWWDEMARKTVLRRLAKRLPMSSDLDDLVRRDDDLYDFKGRRDEPAPALESRIDNPLRDDLPTSATSKMIEGHAEINLSKFDFAVALDGTVLKAAGNEPPQSILDLRFSELPEFDSYDEWVKVCGESDLRTDFAFGRPAQAAKTEEGGSAATQEPAGNAQEPDDGFPGDTIRAEGAKNAPAATAAPASGGSEAATLPYDDAESYMEWFRGVLATAKGATAVKEAWASTRKARAGFLDEDQMVKLGAEKDARVKALTAGNV